MKKIPGLVPIDIPASPDTGAMLRSYFKKKRTFQTGLSRRIGIDSQTMYAYKKRSTMQTRVLWRLCHGLQHNFYADIAAQLPTHYTTDAAVDTTAAARIAELEQKVLLLTAERDVLLKVAGGR